MHDVHPIEWAVTINSANGVPGQYRHFYKEYLPDEREEASPRESQGLDNTGVDN